MRKITGYGAFGLAGFNIGFSDSANIETLSAIVMLVLGFVWLISAIYGIVSKVKSDKLNEKEQIEEINKHIAERKSFEQKLKELSNQNK